MLREVITLTEQLISKPSVSPNDEGCLDIIIPMLEELGFSIEHMDYTETKNIWAIHGNSGPLIVFAGHTDVVPTGELTQWQHHPFTPVIQDGRLYGRGTTDMKGGLVAMLVAAKHFILENPNYTGRIAFLITSDEEAMAIDGTVKVVEELKQRNTKIDYCIVGEPSGTTEPGDTIKVGRRGSITANLYIKGLQGHIAYPDQSINPVHKALPMLNELIAINWDNGNQFFPPTSLQIANIKAGTGANNVIPGVLYVQFNLRYSNEITAEYIKSAVTKLLAKYKLDDYELEWWHSGKPFLSDNGKLIAAVSQAVHEKAGIKPILDTTGGTSDGRFIADICPEVIEFGTLNHTMHKANEYVDCNDLDLVTQVFKRTLELLLI